ILCVTEDSSTGNFFWFGQTSSGNWQALDNSAAASFSTVTPSNQVSHIVYTYDGTTSRVYLNGVEDDTDPFDPINGLSDDYYTGSWDGIDHFDGEQDEIRFSRVQRSASWINTTYQTISNYANFFELGPEQIVITPNYQLEWEHQVQGVDTTKEILELTIFGFSSYVDESYEIQIWNSSSSDWTNPIEIKIGTIEQWYNITISGNGILGSTITWRYRGDNADDDRIETKLNIDYAGIASYDDIPSFTSTPSDLQYNEGNTGNILTWNSTDANPESFTIYQNGNQIDTGTWTNTAGITMNVDGLSKGNYNYTIVIVDSIGRQATDTAWVNVVDGTDPVFVTTPNDVEYEEGANGNSLIWNSTDNYPDTYVIYQNGSQLDTNNWTNTANITINVDGLARGTHNYTIVITDDSGNQASDTLFVTVIDGTDPTFVSTPIDLQYNEASTGNTLIWNSTDVNPNNYTIFRNGSQVDTGSWTNAAVITHNIDGLTKGVYNYTIVITDTTGHRAIDAIFVTVVDGSNPIYVSVPNDLQYNEGDTANTLTWNSTDSYPDTYVIYRNESQVDTGSWSNGADITINIDGLSKGVYNFTIVITDLSNNQAFDTAIVTINDVVSPSFTSTPTDMLYAEGNTSNHLDWNATDLHSGTYFIYQNGSQVSTNTWVSGVIISYNVDGLAKGFYNFSIVILDTSGNSIEDAAIVTVVDLTAPSLSTPADVQYNEGTTNNKIIWNAYDNYPDGMSIYRNGTIIFSTSWTSGDIEINVDGLSAGVYNYTIKVLDKSSNYDSETVYVIVIDYVIPTISSPLDVNYIEESTGNNIDWIGIDIHADAYVLYQNGSQVATSTWSSGLTISYNIDGLLIGVYNFTIF
ncbi:MAG: LamG-like jellyroll fold domain-containing protein, partial [Candidatus Kariarchaeaceae archaeon]